MEPELWNIRGLQAPPTITVRSTIREIDLKLLKNITKEAADHYKNQALLSKEAALLSRVIYRMKPANRQWKFFKLTMKLNQALLRYLNLNVQEGVDRLYKLLPVYNSKDQMYLPARHMLYYLLVKLQGLGQLFKRILNTCLEGSEWIQLTLRIGHSWKYLIIVYSIFARVYVIVKGMLKYTCDLYFNLLSYTAKLPEAQKWLPEDYCFPEHLNVWLGIDWLDLDKTIIEIPDDEPVISYYNLLDSDDDDDDIEITDEYVVVREESPEIDSQQVIDEGLNARHTQAEEAEFYALDQTPLSSTQAGVKRKFAGKSLNKKAAKKMMVAKKGNASPNKTIKENTNAKKKGNKNVNKNVKKKLLTHKIKEKKRMSKNRRNKKIQ